MKLKPTLMMLCSLIGAQNLSADTFGVTGTSGYGTLDPNSIYIISTLGQTVKLADTAVEPNSLAYNDDANVYYYGDHNGTNLYAYDFANNTNVLVADLRNHGMPTNYKLTGGADYYNGTYYYSPELPEVTSAMIPQQAHEIYAINFSPDGKTIQSHDSLNITLPTGWSSLGDFGDIAVDTSKGILYGSSWAPNGSITDGAYFWKIDLKDANKQVVVVGQTSTSNDNVYQIAYDAIENALFGNEWNTEDYFVIDTNTGMPTTPLYKVGGNFYDLASTNLKTADVPEPSSTLLLGLGIAGGLLRRRR